MTTAGRNRGNPTSLVGKETEDIYAGLFHEVSHRAIGLLRSSRICILNELLARRPFDRTDTLLPHSLRRLLLLQNLLHLSLSLFRLFLRLVSSLGRLLGCLSFSSGILHLFLLLSLQLF